MSSKTAGMKFLFPPPCKKILCFFEAIAKIGRQKAFLNGLSHKNVPIFESLILYNPDLLLNLLHPIECTSHSSYKKNIF